MYYSKNIQYPFFRNLLLCLSIFALAGVVCWNLHQRLGYRKQALSRSVLEQRIAAFSFKHIVARCKKEHGYTEEDMGLLEQELKRYFLLIALDPMHKRSLDMYSRDVDNLWHAFILFTKEYHDFSHQIYGRYIHHVPNIDKAREKTVEERIALQKAYRDFILYYEETFNESINQIWLLDALWAEERANSK